MRDEPGMFTTTSDLLRFLLFLLLCTSPFVVFLLFLLWVTR